MRHRFGLGAVAGPASVLLLAAVAGCSAPTGSVSSAAATSASKQESTPATSSVPTFTMKGSFDLFVPSGSVNLPNGAECKGTGDYSDAMSGTAVKVFDGQGHLLATGYLGMGKFQSNPIGTACVFGLTVSDVPDGYASYSVEVGDHGEQVVSSSAAHVWVAVTVGP